MTSTDHSASEPDSGVSASLNAAIEEPVALAPYDPAWPALFEVERARLLDVLPGAFVAIEHIGSTAIPGLMAKPIMDMMAGVDSMATAIGLSVPLRLDREAYTAAKADFVRAVVDGWPPKNR